MCMGTPEPPKISVNLAEAPSYESVSKALRQPLGKPIGETVAYSVDPATGQQVSTREIPAQPLVMNTMGVPEATRKAVSMANDKYFSIKKEIEDLRFSLGYKEGEEASAVIKELELKEQALESVDLRRQRLADETVVAQSKTLSADVQLQALTKAREALAIPEADKGLTVKERSKLLSSLGVFPGGTLEEQQASVQKALRSRQETLATEARQQMIAPVTRQLTREELGEQTTIRRGREQLKIVV